MTSKEALNFIIKTFNKLAQKPQDIGLFFNFCEAHGKVKQDLDKLEQLEKENFELRQKLNTEEECCVMLEKTVKNLRKVINILQTNFFIDLIEREKDYKLGFAPKNEIKEQPRFCELDKETGDFLKEFFYE